ncbi:glycerol kinase 5-like [Styela clava]
MAKVKQTSFKLSGGEGDAGSTKNYVLSLDIGTSNIRCHVYDKKVNMVGRSCQPIKIKYIGSQGVEIDPDELWQQVLEVMKGALEDAKITADEAAALGISVQRGTFLLWDKETGKPFHNFIVWQDTRGEKIERDWNESYTMKVVKAGGKVAHSFSRQKRFMAAAVINFRTNHVTIRLLWALEQNKKLRPLAKEGKVRLGTLDTWLIWKFTSGKTYCTEMSNASSTGIYDPFIQDWNSFFCNLMSVPYRVFPPVWDTNADFGVCDAKFFGSEIPIRAALGDQQSAMYGQCCFKAGEVKLTMGTGTFMCMNIAEKPHASVEGFYPVTAWKRGSEIVHLAEGSCNTAGDAIDWLVRVFGIESPAHTEAIAKSVSDTNGVYFVPAFSGLQAPDNDFSACGSLMGLKGSTSRAQIVRAVLESLAFKNAQIFVAMTSEVSYPVKRVVCDGGVTANNFIMQLTSDLIDQPIQRMKKTDMSALGAAFMAGRAVGVWKDDDCLKDLLTVETIFYPDKKRAQKYAPIIVEWKKAIERSKKWYQK